jgi:asparagine synthase (glutamine-hydrolysing)
MQMCGIAGCYGVLDQGLLKEMLKILRERGPDDESIFEDAPVTLGVTRLAIVDIIHGKQPLSNETNTIWGILNGEIYNFRDIRSQLENLGHVFASDSDTEVIVHAFEEWNVGCLEKLNGMFAFAVWDKKSNSLFLARDRIGIKPLYYVYDENRLIFASEIKALLADKSLQRIPNDEMVFYFLSSGFQKHDGETFFKGIYELLPSSYMKIDGKGISIKKYWGLTNFSASKVKTDKSVVSFFRELLIDSIKIQLPTDLYIGTYLSGGLDSSLIAGLAYELLNSPSSASCKCPNQVIQELISAVYNEVNADERPFIEDVSRKLRTKVNYVFPSSQIQSDDLKRFVYYMDEPVTVLNYYVYWCLSRITKGNVKVTFSGQGPDEFLAGHPDHLIAYLRELWKNKRIGRLLLEFFAGLNRYGFLNVLKEMLMRLSSRGIRIEGLLKLQRGSRRKLDVKAVNSLDKALFLDVTQNRLPMHMRVGDRVSSAFSIESRFPYLDHRIVEFAFSLPPDQKIRNGWTKYPLRFAAKGVVPESVRVRKKRGTPIPIELWMENLHPMIDGVFNSKEFRERPYFNHVAILDLYKRYHEKRLSSLQRKSCVEILWRILNVELWLESFFDVKYSPGQTA